jgi:hypothetical protein
VRVCRWQDRLFVSLSPKFPSVFTYKSLITCTHCPRPTNRINSPRVLPWRSSKSAQVTPSRFSISRLTLVCLLHLHRQPGCCSRAIRLASPLSLSCPYVFATTPSPRSTLFASDDLSPSRQPLSPSPDPSRSCSFGSTDPPQDLQPSGRSYTGSVASVLLPPNRLYHSWASIYNCACSMLCFLLSLARNFLSQFSHRRLNSSCSVDGVNTL